MRNVNKKRQLFIFSVIFTTIAILTLYQALYAQQHPIKLGQLNFLLGEWIGEGGGTPGQGTGAFTFTNDLQNSIIIRRNYAEYPASADKPAYRHDDLTIIYQTPDDTIRAQYFDNERHVINYIVNADTLKKSATFISAVMPSSPRYRLTYSIAKTDTASIKFEIAPPGQPEAFSTFIEAAAHRK
jgi:hypothetical protein